MSSFIFVQRFAPIGICSLIAGNLVALNDILGTMQGLGMYMVTVIIGTLIHSTVILPCIYFVVTRKSPLRLLTNTGKAILTAFGAGSG